MFTGQSVDNRTPKQKNTAKQRELPQQAEMFSQRELAVFGANGRPRMPLSPKTRLELVMQDVRTQEEKDRDLQMESEKRTYLLPGFEMFAPSHYEMPAAADEGPNETNPLTQEAPFIILANTEAGMEIRLNLPGASICEFFPEGIQSMEASIEAVGALLLQMWSTRERLQGDEMRLEIAFELVAAQVTLMANCLQIICAE